MQFYMAFNRMIGAGAVILLAVLIIVVLILVFEILMLIDVIKNEGIATDQKILWIIGMFLIHPFVAIAYYIYSRHYQNPSLR